jgi:hypothetical protein
MRAHAQGGHIQVHAAMAVATPPLPSRTLLHPPDPASKRACAGSSHSSFRSHQPHSLHACVHTRREITFKITPLGLTPLTAQDAEVSVWAYVCCVCVGWWGRGVQQVGRTGCPGAWVDGARCTVPGCWLRAGIAATSHPLVDESLDTRPNSPPTNTCMLCCTLGCLPEAVERKAPPTCASTFATGLPAVGHPAHSNSVFFFSGGWLCAWLGAWLWGVSQWPSGGQF